MSPDVWSERAAMYVDSDAHRDGDDLETLVDWATAAGAATALDIATGGGHVARRLREAAWKSSRPILHRGCNPM